MKAAESATGVDLDGDGKGGKPAPAFVQKARKKVVKRVRRKKKKPATAQSRAGGGGGGGGGVADMIGGLMGGAGGGGGGLRSGKVEGKSYAVIWRVLFFF